MTMASAASGEFAKIGNAEPPVELTVLTMTYNHEKYIGECMDSVLMQKTSFPVRHIVFDHASRDSTPEIIRAYAAKHSSIEPVLPSQRVPGENVRGLFERCRTKYAALCDGDDYFLTPDKLQRQVDYLEKRPRCSMCFHPVRIDFEDGRESSIFPDQEQLRVGQSGTLHLARLTESNFIQTNSAVYRWRFRDGLPEWFRADLCPGDWYWHLLHAEVGLIGFLPEIMAGYRRHANALYMNAIDNQRKHWRRFGLHELKTYHVCNKHFRDRYFRNFSWLATGVLAGFLEISLEEGDKSLMERAVKKYPRFASDFYKNLRSDRNSSS